MKKISVGTIFSGIGAFEFALKRKNINHEIEFACDNGNINLEIDYKTEFINLNKLKSSEEKNQFVREIYKNNSKRTNYIERSYIANYKIDNKKFFYDVKLFDGNDFKNKIDILVGGSPCQSFSAIGNREGFEDARGTLFYEYARIVSEVQPKVFIYENVFGVLTHDNKKTWKIMQKIFLNLGYHIKFEVLNSKDFGIPQSRRRLFVIGFKEQKFSDKFEFPKKEKLKYSMKDFLENKVFLGDFISNKKGMIEIKKNGNYKTDAKYFLSEKLKKYVFSPGTKNFYHKNAKIDLDVARALLSTMGNSHRASVNNYITENGETRALTEREAHRLMGFTDEYLIVNSRSQSYKQAGNSIVVDVILKLNEQIFKTGVFDNE
ncbi:Modification methylase [Mesoplasma florum W37]|uniref:Cytosine-specific methyltransferase n=1 Tax=Mesoplasma florum TaxID=2151 RepID=A0AAD2JDL7_MESFO|nr:DNA (cytosine-5-)-methyltransferase [Mesoplasma florum]AGY41391.1 Modification methylase [Mesoplasma florum W37]AVN65731.1 Modification methylase [Mesoplasma florum]